jgi:hypothetical protein
MCAAGWYEETLNNPDLSSAAEQAIPPGHLRYQMTARL